MKTILFNYLITIHLLPVSLTDKNGTFSYLIRRQQQSTRISIDKKNCCAKFFSKENVSFLMT